MWKAFGVTWLVACVIAMEVDYHDTLDNDYDFENASSEVFDGMIECLLDRGPCSEVAQSYKGNYPDVMYEACARCTPSQKHMIRISFDRIKSEFPQKYLEFRNKWDPDNLYMDKYEASVVGF